MRRPTKQNIRCDPPSSSTSGPEIFSYLYHGDFRNLSSSAVDARSYQCWSSLSAPVIDGHCDGGASGRRLVATKSTSLPALAYRIASSRRRRRCRRY